MGKNQLHKRKVLLTGASGFVGSRLCEVAAEKKQYLRRALRVASGESDITVGDISPATDWSKALEEMDCLVHLAARVHVMNGASTDSLAEFRRINVESTLNLARQAALSGLKRFVFVSSIKVNGESTRPGCPFTIKDVPSPQDDYALSKFEAEQGLQAIAKETGLEIVIIRPPLVYGPGVKANFFRLMRGVEKGFPLPLGLVKNKRSFVGIDNLIDVILICLDHPDAGGQSFFVSDGEDLSTPDLIEKLSAAMGRRIRLLPVPPVFLRLGGRMSGNSAAVERLIGSLQVDINHTCETLEWQPPVSVDEGLNKTVKWYLNDCK